MTLRISNEYTWSSGLQRPSSNVHKSPGITIGCELPRLLGHWHSLLSPTIRREIVVALHSFTPLPSRHWWLDQAYIEPDVASTVEVISAHCGPREPCWRSWRWCKIKALDTKLGEPPSWVLSGSVWYEVWGKEACFVRHAEIETTIYWFAYLTIAPIVYSSCLEWKREFECGTIMAWFGVTVIYIVGLLRISM